LRYFVLDPGRPGAFGVAPTPARIAVLMDSAPPRPSPPEEPWSAPPAAETEEETGTLGEDDDLESRLRRVSAALAEAVGIEIASAVTEDRDAVTLELRTSEPEFFLGADGEGAPFRALEHLLHRMFAPVVHPLKLRLVVEGYREARDEALRREALRLVSEVRRDRVPRETAPLNAYERRIVHLAVATAGGVASRSEGEGAARRVVISPAPDASAGGEVH
jgi:spoIIIJ-associated protein